MECIINDGEGAYVSTVFAKEGGMDGNKIVAYDRHKTCIKIIYCYDENDDAVAKTVTCKWSQPCGKCGDWLIFDEAFADGELLDWLENDGQVPVDDFSPFSGRVEEYTPDSWSEFASEEEFSDIFDFGIYEPGIKVERRDKNIFASLDCYGFIVDLHFSGVREEKYVDLIDKVYFSTLTFEGRDAVRWTVTEAKRLTVNGVRHMLDFNVFQPAILCDKLLWRVRFVQRVEDNADGQAGKLYNLVRDDFADIVRDGDSIILKRASSVREMRWQEDGFEAVVDGKVINKGIKPSYSYTYARDFFSEIGVEEIQGEILLRTPAHIFGRLMLSKASALVIAAMGLIAGIVLLALQTYIWQGICILVAAAAVAVADIAIIMRAVKAKHGEYILTKDVLYLAEGGLLREAIWLREIGGAEFRRSLFGAHSGRAEIAVRDLYPLKVTTMPMKDGDKFCRLLNDLVIKLSNS